MFTSSTAISTAMTGRLRFARPGTGVLLDFAIAATALAGTLAQVAHGSIGGVFAPLHGVGELSPVSVVPAALSTVPLVAWRRYPLGVLVMTAAAGVLLAGLGNSIDLLLGPGIALYLLAASRQQVTPWTRQTTAIVVGLLAVYLGVTGAAQGSFPGTELLHTGLAWAVAWFAGERTRLVREQIAELRERALWAEREAEHERRLAAAEERARIARDLHDSAGHAINVIAVRAGAARLWHRQYPDRSLAALEVIEEVARQTVEEIDQIVGTLREDGPANGAVESPPGLASLESLIAQHAAAGFDVTVDVSGAPRPLGATVDQAVYRILQEALTNAARHGAGSADIQLAFDGEAIELSVTNPVLKSDAPRSGGGHGLVGMHERASMLGGWLSTQRSSHSFRLRARIPYARQPA